MKLFTRTMALSGLMLILCPALISCKASAATNKREFKKELHHIERAH